MKEMPIWLVVVLWAAYGLLVGSLVAIVLHIPL